MKLLLDENLSPRLIALIEETFPGSRHVEDCGLISATDEEIWRYAQRNGFAIVSKDSDFSERGLIDGSPPKVIWLRLGNCTTLRVAFLLRNVFPRIQAFLASDKENCLVLTVPVERTSQHAG